MENKVKESPVYKLARIVLANKDYDVDVFTICADYYPKISSMELTEIISAAIIDQQNEERI